MPLWGFTWSETPWGKNEEEEITFSDFVLSNSTIPSPMLVTSKCEILAKDEFVNIQKDKNTRRELFIFKPIKVKLRNRSNLHSVVDLEPKK